MGQVRSGKPSRLLELLWRDLLPTSKVALLEQEEMWYSQEYIKEERLLYITYLWRENISLELIRREAEEGQLELNTSHGGIFWGSVE